MHTMITRRTTLLSLGGLAVAAAAPTESFSAYVAELRVLARKAGVSQGTIDHALGHVQLIQRAIDLDRHQPESTLTWAQYRQRIVNDQRIALGRKLYSKHRELLARVTQRYGVEPGVIMGIWALESNYGADSGKFPIVDSLVTLAWEGRRRAFFQSEAIDALKVLDRGDITLDKMVGSYAGAMGQTQFMPDSVLKYSVDFNGDGRRDLWSDMGDIFASTANYLAREGWQSTLTWGRPIVLPSGFDASLAGHAKRRPLAEWARLGVPLPAIPMQTVVSVVLPGGAGDEAFLTYWPNYKALRSYNPPDKYCLSVGLLGDAITA